jgi:hypothetical protein
MAGEVPQVACARCKTRVSRFSDEFAEWVWIEGDGEIPYPVCLDCLTDDERPTAEEYARQRELQRHLRQPKGGDAAESG